MPPYTSNQIVHVVLAGREYAIDIGNPVTWEKLLALVKRFWQSTHTLVDQSIFTETILTLMEVCPAMQADIKGLQIDVTYQEKVALFCVIRDYVDPPRADQPMTILDILYPPVRVVLGGREYRIDVAKKEIFLRLKPLEKLHDKWSTKQIKAIEDFRAEALRILFSACPEMRRDQRRIDRHSTYSELGAALTAIGDCMVECAGVS